MFTRMVGFALAISMVVSGAHTPPLPAQDTEEVAKLRLELEAARLTLKKAQDDLVRLKVAEADLKKIISLREQAIIALQNSVADFRTKALANEQLARALRDRNEQLLKEVQALSVRVAKDSAAPPLDSKPPLAANPPKKMLKGKIQRIDPNNLVTISIGKDHGISVNHTLEVFRTEPEPRYLGLVRIIEVSADTCVGRPILPPGATKRQKLLVGDNAWSKLSE